MVLKVIGVLFLVFSLCNAFKILLFFPYPGKSHTLLGNGYLKILLNAGHEVTYVTPIPVKYTKPNLRQIDVSSNMADVSFDSVLNIKDFIENKNQMGDKLFLYKLMHEIANKSITHENVQTLMLDQKEQFDVVIAEWLYTEFYAGLGSLFNCPLIWSSSIEPHAMILRLVDDIPSPAYFPDHMSSVQIPLTFWERAQELYVVMKLYFIRWSLCSMEQKDYKLAYEPAFMKRGLNLPSYEVVKFNGSLILGNSHASSGLAIRLPVNYVSIAGYHIDETVDPLPKNLQKIIEDSKHGVIYFSLGSMMKGKTMSDEMKRGFLKTFGSLKQTVIWKFEEKLTNLPKNVHLLEWAPQQSILAHPNVILFVTHGGLLSTSEALHFGVPIIGIPLFADQFINIKRAVDKGFAKEVKLGYDTPEKLKSAIEEVLSTPRYKENLNELSFVYHHRPVPPRVELVHWVEHVVRTRGAPHLRSPALNVPFYQKLYLDLIALILVVISVIFVIVKRCISMVLGGKVDLDKKRK